MHKIDALVAVTRALSRQEITADHVSMLLQQYQSAQGLQVTGYLDLDTKLAIERGIADVSRSDAARAASHQVAALRSAEVQATSTDATPAIDIIDAEETTQEIESVKAGELEAAKAKGKRK